MDANVDSLSKDRARLRRAVIATGKCSGRVTRKGPVESLEQSRHGRQCLEITNSMLGNGKLILSFFNIIMIIVQLLVQSNILFITLSKSALSSSWFLRCSYH